MRRCGLLLGLAAAAASALGDVDIPFELCGDDKLGLEKVQISAYPVRAGEVTTLSIYLTPKVEVTGGSIEMSLSFFGHKVYQGSHDICTEAAGVSCPLEAGKQVVLSTKQAVPKEVPTASVDVHLVGVDSSGNELSCIDTQVQIERFFTHKELESIPAISGALIGDVLMARPKWKPGLSRRFENATLKHAAALCGTVLKGAPGYISLPDRDDWDHEKLRATNIPESFDARDQWPQCKQIGHVRDQSSCGSCWAFSTTEAFNDRMCISKGFDGWLSPADTAACCHMGGSMGCNGGQPAGAWMWFTETGVVTGGDNDESGQGKSCWPYPFASCAHHVEPDAEHPACPDEEYDTPRCRRACAEAKYTSPYREDKRFTNKAYSVRGVAKIQQEIMERGPVSAALTVYSDFLTYESGVYHHVSGSALGGHAVKVIGWGVEDGVPHWIVTNSWNDGWGEKGTFKILRGENECGIESEITAGYFS